MKTCSKCKTEYPATPDYFKRHKGQKDGLNSWCKVCTKKDSKRQKVKMSWSKRLVYSTKYTNRKDASRSHLSHTITKEHLEAMYNNQSGLCYYSGIKLDTNRKSKFKAISCDRIDNSKGYTPDNVVLCCRFFNLGRCDGDFNEFKEFLKENIIK